MAGTPNLSPVFLDSNRVVLQGNPRPSVSAILSASGKPAETQVVWVRAPDEKEGRRLAPDEVIDRTEKAHDAIYLHCT